MEGRSKSSSSLIMIQTESTKGIYVMFHFFCHWEWYWIAERIVRWWITFFLLCLRHLWYFNKDNTFN